MDFSLTPDQQNIREAILKHCSLFPDEYWLARDRDGVFPHEFVQSLIERGWLGIAMPTQYGGSGLGITEAAVMMQAIAESGAAMLFGTQAQKDRILPAVVSGKDRVCFAVTEPNVGLNTTELKTRAERREGGYLVNGEKIWISTAQVSNKMLLLARTTPLDQVKR
jgi:acyl-CoA dehydrogenase